MKRALWLLLVVAVLAALWLLPVRELSADLLAWAREAGPGGALAFALAYVLATVLLVPASVLTVGAGAVWGPGWGTAIVLPSATLGASLAFLLGRSVLRDRVDAWTAERPVFAAVDAAVAEGGLTTVLLIRLSPLFPFNMTNYALGATSLRLRDYVVGSFVGMLPGVLVYTWIGRGLARLTDTPERTDASRILFWVGLVATVAVTAQITRMARRRLDLALGD